MQTRSFAQHSPRCGFGTRQVRCRAAQTQNVTKPAFRYEITEKMKETFKRDGFVHLRGVMTDEEMRLHVDPVYNKFMKGEVAGAVSLDGEDASGGAEAVAAAPAETASVLDVMLPRDLFPEWQGNLLEQKAEDIAMQLLDTDEVELDFDQILAKRPRSRDSGLPWHQDAAYWPPELTGYDCSTANMWVAVSDVPVESGCMRYVAGSHREANLRPHEPVSKEDSDVHNLKTLVKGEQATMVPMKRGDIVVHRENVVHGSGPNVTDEWRCAYILNYKRSTCVVTERALGYTHAQKEASQVPFKP